MSPPAARWLAVLLAPCWLACRARPTPPVPPRLPAKPPQAVGAGETIEAVDERGQPLTFRIDSVEPDPKDPDGEITFYGLSVRGPGGGAWTPYCAPDREGKSRAIPLAGSWDERSAAARASDKVTFACTSGALGKCVRFGYKPWKVVAGRSLADLHAACVRMVRADYCGDGRPHTRDGTRIDMWDPLGIQKRDAPADAPEVFEAAWSPSGAVWVNVPRWEDTVDRLVGECPDRLRGHTSNDARLSPEDVARRFPDALLFDARFIRSEQRLAAGAPLTDEHDPF